VPRLLHDRDFVDDIHRWPAARFVRADRDLLHGHNTSQVVKSLITVDTIIEAATLKALALDRWGEHGPASVRAYSKTTIAANS
jgi:hypothetical protein